jgi:hypothetical protein
MKEFFLKFGATENRAGFTTAGPNRIQSGNFPDTEYREKRKLTG